MAIKISNCLDAALALTTFDLTKDDINYSYLDHIALTLLRDESSIAYQELRFKLQDWEFQQLSIRIRHLIAEQPLQESLTPKDFFTNIRHVLLTQNNEKEVTTLHLLRLIAATTHSATSQVLSHFGITAHSFSDNTPPYANIETGQSFLDNEYATTNLQIKAAPAHSLIEKYATDLTRQAEEGELDPVIGREDDIARLIRILCRRKKNNPILIGEAGVGKSAVVEALALKIVSQNVPKSLKNKKIYSLDMAALVAGTKFRGEFEERMQQLIQELRSQDHVILFIDEIHTITGAGATQGSLDVANILKPALARAEIRLIGATTYDEYRRHIECDAALARRLQRVTINPPTPAETLNILKHIAPNYEQHHGVQYAEDALWACIELSERYLTDRNLPDKAIDLMDEAGAYAHQHNIIGTQIIDKTAIERLVTLATGIPVEQLSLSERERIAQLPQHLMTRIVGQKKAIEQLSRTLQLHKSGLRRHNRPIGIFLFTGPTGVGKTLLAKELSESMFNHKRGLIRIDMSEYGERHNASRLIGSPPGYVGYGEGGELSEAVRRQPYAVVLFDEIEKAHPDILNLMLQIFDEGHLTDGAGRKVDFRNTIIILTSNIGSTQNIEQNRHVTGFNTISKQESIKLKTSTQYHADLEKAFSPEFLNRIDGIICFRELTIDDAMQIIDIELNDLINRSNKIGYTIHIDNNVKRHLAQIGFQPKYGARALRRTILSHIEEPLSQLIVEEGLDTGKVIKISLSETKIQLDVA